MRCVCPMGKNRNCPKGCPLAVWASLTPTDRKSQRKAIVEQLYKQGFTMEVIAAQLGVTHVTISNDLREFVSDLQIKKRPKTKRNPKGAGRPKNVKSALPKKKKRKVSYAQRQEALAEKAWNKRLESMPHEKWEFGVQEVLSRIVGWKSDADWQQFTIEPCTYGLLKQAADVLNHLVNRMIYNEPKEKEFKNVVQH